MTALAADYVRQKLTDLDGWELKDKAISKTFSCDDFSHAMDLVTHAAELAEESDHHPDIDIRYDKVTFALSTHSEGGVTEKDIAMAKQIDGLSS